MVENLNALFEQVGIAAINADPTHLPIGISFFTFQAMTYIIDVYRRDAEVQRSIFRVGLYVALFPQLVAGPIVRYRSIAAQLINRHASTGDVAIGVRRFVVGYAKKALIADQLAEVSDQIFAWPSETVPCGIAWIGAVSFTLQICCDFSAYSDMAIGLGRMFGFRFPENFNAPIRLARCKSFGGAGMSHFLPDFATTSTSQWVAAEAVAFKPSRIWLSYLPFAGYGTGQAETS